MKQTFLNIAENILREVKRPLTPEEIYSIGKRKGIIISKGKTPELSMKARLSTNIRKYGFQSIFMRVGPNKFSLREFGLKEFISIPFKKTIPNETITCINQNKISFIKDHFGFYSDVSNILDILNSENLNFVERKIAEFDPNFKQLISYVILTKGSDQVLTYKRGVYTNAHEMIKGSTCLGFGGHVQDIDTNNMFSKGFGGVYDTAEREIFEELKGFKPENLQIVGYIVDNSSPEGVKHLGIVLRGAIPEDFSIKGFLKELSITDLKFMTMKDVWNNFHEFEFWSQLIIKNLFKPRQVDCLVTIRPVKYNFSSNVFVFIGEIASGKTVLCELLSRKSEYIYISTRSCVAKLIGEEDFGTSGRKVFQEKAEIFIKSPDGPRTLANEIKKQAEMVDGNVIIDGIRHYNTLLELKKFFPELTVVYIDSTRDDAYRNYCLRSHEKVSMDRFREERHHPVEDEIKFLKGEASVYIFNGDSEEQLFIQFLNWYNSNRL